MGGATAFAAGALAPGALGSPAEQDTASPLVTADYVGRASSQAVDVSPMSTDRVVRVESQTAVGSFSRGDDVAVLLPRSAGQVDAEQVGADGPVEARAVTRLVLGDRKDLERAAGR